jgi:hypothetical protein
MKDVRQNGNVLSTFEELGDGTCEVRLFYRQSDGSWRPPLPFDIQAPAERSRPNVRDVLERSDQEAPKVEIPELRADATPQLTVEVCPGALRQIKAELGRASHTMLECIETGGVLFAGQTRLGVLSLIDASGPGEFDGEARRLPDSVRISLRHGHEIAEELRRNWQDENLGVVGSWHTHPIRDARPSETDRRGALLALDDLQEHRGWRAPRQWIDVIVHPDVRDGWEAPRVVGWATRRLEWSGSGITEPVHLVEGT